ncbi:hypothetical protein [Veillonella caviae]|uniref:hypothetical protein n=1 Tax=Veillonella caviae TaxID=248316 RepID=UPI0023F66296|nr:hypothetical protein [Veillonella caviae]
MTHEELKIQVQALADAISSNEAVKTFANAWLAAEGTDKQAELTKKLGSIVKQNIALIDETIDFMSSPTAADIFGQETADSIRTHAEEIKAQGAEFCDCPGCTAAKDIIDHLNEIK